MESIKNAAAYVMGSENNTTQSGREPVSGSTGAGTGTQPYDNGNQQNDPRLGGSSAQHNTTTGSGIGGYGSSQSGSESYGSGNRSNDPRLGSSSAQTTSNTGGYSSGQSHATGNSMVPESIQRMAPEGLERALPDSIHDTSGRGGSSTTGHGTSSSGLSGSGRNAGNSSDFSGLNYVGGDNSTDLPMRTKERDTTSGLGSSTSGMGSSTSGLGSSTSGLAGVGSGQHHGHGHTSDRNYENTGSKLERVPSEELHAISAGKYRGPSELTAASYGVGSGTETPATSGTYLDYDASGKSMGTPSGLTGSSTGHHGTSGLTGGSSGLTGSSTGHHGTSGLTGGSSGLTDRDTRSSDTSSNPLTGRDDRSSHHHSSGTDKILASGTGATGRTSTDATNTSSMGTGSGMSHGLQSGEHGVERNAEARNPNHHFGVIDGGERNPSHGPADQHQSGSSQHQGGGMAEKVKGMLHMGGHK